MKTFLNESTVFIGNILIFISAATLVFIYYPFFSTFLFPKTLSTNLENKGFYVQIPKIKAEAKIIKDVDPFNQKVYRLALLRGVAQALGSDLPGEKGSTYIFAHSYDYPWNLSRYNTIFLRLNELEKGDVIKVFYEKKEYQYVVKEKKVVWPEDLKYLKSEGKDELILQTCTPIGTDLKRLLIFSYLKNAP